MTSTDTLLPCPFCGGEPVLTEHPPHEHSPILKRVMPDFPDHKGSADVSCLDCAVGHLRDTPTEAIAAWNRRTPPTPATEEREAVALAMLNGKRLREGWPITASIPEGFADGDEWRLEAQDALSALAPYRAAEILAAERERDALREALAKTAQPHFWWDTDDSENGCDDITTILDNYDIGEVVEVSCARNLPNQWAVGYVTESGGFRGQTFATEAEAVAFAAERAALTGAA